jgi:hypothetical protein
MAFLGRKHNKFRSFCSKHNLFYHLACFTLSVSDLAEVGSCIRSVSGFRTDIGGLHDAVVDEEECGGEDADSGDDVPGLGGVVFDFGVVVHDAAAEPAGD